MDDQMQKIMDLMAARAAGRATNDEVEAAVEAMLGIVPESATAASPSPTQASSLYQPRSEGTPVVPNNNNPHSLTSTEDLIVTAEAVCDEDATTASFANDNAPPKRKRGRPRKYAANDNKTASSNIDWSIYQDIPLGKQGAQMLLTFGDGGSPLPATVRACLLGARRMLQVVIQDARHVHRQKQTAFLDAKHSLNAQRPLKPSQPHTWSQSIMYRALHKMDDLSRDNKAGLDVEDLCELYPEEMNAFTRWNSMHAEAERRQEAAKNAAAAAADDDEASTNKTPDDDDIPADNDPKLDPVNGGGHLGERLQQFDVRTDRMTHHGYLSFADVRHQGSFLPHTSGRRRRGDASTQAWNAQRTKATGKRAGDWQHMDLVTVRFLHWIGFDPHGPLPPPSHDTAEALAFLGHDFFGRIVECAIQLRAAEHRSADNKNDGGVLELPPGEQLSAADIERAMEHPSIRPVPLYAATATDKKLLPQLYFGRGFEHRLEMELEEMTNNHDQHSAEERAARQADDVLFAGLAQQEPPTAYNLLDLDDLPREDCLDNNDDNDVSPTPMSPIPRKRGRPRKRPASPLQYEPIKRKKHGRPRKSS